MVESTGLENRQGGNSFVGSNPTSSAIRLRKFCYRKILATTRFIECSVRNGMTRRSFSVDGLNTYMTSIRLRKFCYRKILATTRFIECSVRNGGIQSNKIRNVAQPGSALLWGGRGRGFKSRRSDQNASIHRIPAIPHHRDDPNHNPTQTDCDGLSIKGRHKQQNIPP